MKCTKALKECHESNWCEWQFHIWSILFGMLYFSISDLSTHDYIVCHYMYTQWISPISLDVPISFFLCWCFALIELTKYEYKARNWNIICIKCPFCLGPAPISKQEEGHFCSCSKISNCYTNLSHKTLAQSFCHKCCFVLQHKDLIRYLNQLQNHFIQTCVFCFLWFIEANPSKHW